MAEISRSRQREPDGPMVRRVRWQLVAWSAGSTFAVLLVLGTLLYAAVATTLTSSSEDLLRNRASLLVGSASSGLVALPTLGPGEGEAITVVGGGTLVASGDAALPGFTATGPYAGTIGVLVAASSTVGATPIDVPDPLGYATAQSGVTALRETTYQGSPVRVLSVPVPRSGPGAAGAPLDVVQIVGDRSSEMRTLTTLLWVLVGGGLVALVAATLIGSLYASRALVPIRSSLQRQREFAADTSHELRTPLAVIRAGLARVRQQPEARVADVGPALDALDAETIRLTALVDDLLALARTDAGAADLDLVETDLAEIAADALAALHPFAGTREVRLELDVEPARLRADPVRLRRLVTVLVDNGIRHGRAGGLVRVTVRPGRLTVDDDGPGVAAADRPHVFDRFWRGAQAAPGGSGLGLAIAAWIVERHGGRIEVGVSPLGGARFDVFLPIR